METQFSKEEIENEYSLFINSEEYQKMTVAFFGTVASCQSICISSDGIKYSINEKYHKSLSDLLDKFNQDVFNLYISYPKLHWQTHRRFVLIEFEDLIKQFTYKYKGNFNLDEIKKNA